MELTNLQKENVIKAFLSEKKRVKQFIKYDFKQFNENRAKTFLSDSENNKGNGYRLGFAHGYGRQIELRIPRDRLGAFYPVVLALIRQQDELIEELRYSLYSKGLTTREIGEVLEMIYGKHYSKSQISRINTSFYHEMEKCTVHLKRNILSYVRKEHKREIMEDLDEVLNPDDKNYTKDKAMKRLQEFSQKWGKYYKYILYLPKKEDIEYYFTYLDYDYRIRRMIYSTNWIERFNKSCRRTLKIRNSFPTPEAALALITSVAMDKENKTYNYSIINFKFEPKFL